MHDPDPRMPPVGPPERLRGLPSWLINQLRVVATRQVAERLGGLGVRDDYAVLATLAEFGPSSQAEVGRRLGIDRSNLVALFNRLEADGLVVRERDERDRRRHAIRLTSAARRRLASLDRRVALAQDDLLGPLSDAERATLVALLQRALDHSRTNDGDGDGA